MNLWRSSEMIMQFGGSVLGATMKKGRLHVATCLSCLSCHSFYNFFTNSMPLSINLTLIKLYSDRLTLLEAFCFFLPIRLYVILEASFLLTMSVSWGDWVRTSPTWPGSGTQLQLLLSGRISRSYGSGPELESSCVPGFWKGPAALGFHLLWSCAPHILERGQEKNCGQTLGKVRLIFSAFQTRAFSFLFSF